MKPTRLGVGCMVMAGLTLLTAASTGNNLLYLVFGCVSASIASAVLLGRRNLQRCAIEAEIPPQTFRAQPFTLPLRVSVPAGRSSYGIEAVWQGSHARAERIAHGEPAVVSVRGALPHRGLNSLDDLVVESSYPFGFFRFRRPVAAAVLALPRPLPVREPREVASAAQAAGRPTLKRGQGEELYGIRDFAPGDDARILNWKLSARLGRPLVNEYCAAQDDKILVGLPAGAQEDAIVRAASACKYYIDAGAEVRLETGEESVGYGRGLPQLDKLLAALARVGEGRTARSIGAPPKAGGSRAEASAALRRATLALMFAVFGGMFLVDDIEPTLLLAALPFLLAGVLVQEKRFQVLPRRGWNLLSAAVLGYTVLVDWRLRGVTISNTHLLLYLLINRALTPYVEEEYAQVFLILFLAFFLVSGLTISPWYFLLLLFYLGASGLWLTLAAGAPWERRRSWLKGLAAATLAGVALGTLVFTAMPRVEGLRRINPFLAAGIDKLSVQPSGVTAFTEDVNLGFFGRLKKSSARFMRIKPEPSPGESRPADIYVRGAAYDVFDGSRWSRAGRRVAYARRVGDQQMFPVSAPVRNAPSYDMSIYPMNLSVAFTVGTPAYISGADVVAGFDANDTVRFAAPYQGGIRYTVRPSPDAGIGALRPGYAETMLRRDLELPQGEDPRIAVLAAKITGGAKDPASKAAAVQLYLRKRYGYSLYSDGKRTGLADFLFTTRKGNCEYFATAGAIILRHSGVPARLVTGFLAGDWNEYGKFYDVRQSEAHAWVEYYAPGRGWVAFDPTPSQSAFEAGFEEFGKKLEHWASALEAQWYRHVIGYDQYVQHDTFRRLGDAFSPAALKGFAEGAGYAVGLAAVLFLGFVGWDRLRRPTPPPPTLLQRAEKAVKGKGVARAPHQTAREFARVAAGDKPELAPLHELAELHYRDRFDPRGLTDLDRARAEALLVLLSAGRG